MNLLRQIRTALTFTRNLIMFIKVYAKNYSKFQKKSAKFLRNISLRHTLYYHLECQVITRAEHTTQKFTQLNIYSRVNFLLLNFYAICQKYAALLYFKGIIL